MAAILPPKPADTAPAIDSARAKLAGILADDAKQRAANRAIRTAGVNITRAMAHEIRAALDTIGSTQHSVVQTENTQDVTRHGITVANLGGIAGIALEFDLVYADGDFRCWEHKGRPVDTTEIITIVMRSCIFAYEQALAARRGRAP